MRGTLRTLWRGYWPLAVLPVAAGLLDLLLWVAGEAWSWSDWASSFGLGAVATMVVGMLLARRQGHIQEAMADLELTEKVAILTAAVPLLRAGSLPSRTHRTLYDCRAGLALLPLAREAMQEEYLRTVVRAVAAVRASLTSSLRAHTQWTDEDWADLVTVVRKLRETAVFNARRSPTMAEFWARELDGETARLGALTGGVTFDLFRTHFTQSTDRIRTALDWDALAGLAAREDGSVRLDKLSVPVAPYDLAALDGYYAPWYHDGAREIGYDHERAQPLRHRDLAGDGSVLHPERQARVQHLYARYEARHDGEEIGLLLATYALDGDRRLVLDGNHRLSAVARLVAEGCPALLTEIRLTAPVDPALLPDLAHHRPPAGESHRPPAGEPPRQRTT
ncbi:hypothetical protein [Streptomyces sp. HPF1205]|uniref:hypothetical protein n=1 Tax=Streptomyces sp. HPF1205 TaxID=2873262 RepID=UPI001CEDF815|nr:hypothetical protein [Streptomyces sp. HPF1205]